MSCRCSQDFIVEACDLATGTVRAILDPISMDWQANLNGWGQGSLMLATKELRVRDAWPGLTSIYISRTSGGGGASRTNPVAEFSGLVESVSATEAGTTTIGMVAIESYLNRRTLKGALEFDQVEQTEIAADLVRQAEFNGIPLFAEAASSSFPRNRQYPSWARKVIGEALEDLSQVLNGPDWEVVHTRQNGRWSTTMIFRDFVGVDRTETVRLESDRELSAYSLTIDGVDQATWVDAIGSGEEEDQLLVTSVDPAGIYPEYDAVPAWKDVTRLTTLQSHADGYLEDYREPRATPTFTIAGLDPSPSVMRNGDMVHVRQDFGALSFHGNARIISTSWALGEGAPVSRTFEVLPLVRASQSVLNQTAQDRCKGGC